MVADPAGEAFASGTIEFEDRSFRMTLLPECSVSDHIRTKAAFYELPFLESLRGLLPPGCRVVDVGAHIGNHTLFFAGVLGMQVMAFEPNPEAFAALESNVRANQLEDLVRCIPLALSDVVTKVRMARRWPGDAGTLSIMPSGGADGGYAVEVDTDMLDNYAADLEPGPLYVKLDVEGHEPAVIRGGPSVFRRGNTLVSAEIQDLAMFDEIKGLLEATHAPAGLYNATPTLLLAPKPPDPEIAGIGARSWGMARYAIDASVNYGKARSWSIENARRADRATDEVDKLQTETMRLEAREGLLLRAAGNLLEGLPKFRNRTPSHEWLEALLGLRDLQPDLPRRVALLSLAEPRFPGAVLAVVFDVVHLVERIADDTFRMRSMEGGHCAREELVRVTNDNDLMAAEIVQFLDGGEGGAGSIESLIITGGESEPNLESAIISLIDAPYALVSFDPAYQYSRLFALVGAEALYLDDAADFEAWNRVQILPAIRLDASDPIDLAVRFPDGHPRVEPASTGRHVTRPAASRVLLISYYAPPATPVSVHRLSYWSKNLSILAGERGHDLETTWVTATVPAAANPGTLVVKDHGPWMVSDDRRPKIDDLVRLDLDPLGASWSDYVEKAAGWLGGPYTTVIISGNPFYYFDLAGFFRREWGSKVILDFRDPFAYNTRHRYTTEQRAHLIGLEREWVRAADAIISVNRFCLESVAPDVPTKRYIVANGYDERVVDSIDHPTVRDASPVRIAYSGTIFAKLPVDNLLDALDQNRHRFIHFGRDYSASRATESHPAAESMGLLSYEELIRILKGCHAGIVMTSGEASTQTTKLFDYLACDLDVIIVTRGKPHTGDLASLTDGIPGVYWVKDDPSKLRKFFAEYEPSGQHRQDRDRFSRREQTLRLLDLVLELEKGRS